VPTGGTGLAPRLPKTKAELHKGRRLIVFLDEAKLEAIKTSHGYALLNCDEHRHLHKKFKRNPADSRPDICHQSLLTLLDSPLNKAGLLKIYIRTSKNVLIEVHPSLRIPRTIKRFSGLMVQLLHKLRIRSVDGPDTLLRVIKNPIEAHLPAGCRKYVTSCAGRLVNVHKFVKTFPSNEPIVVSFGQMSHGTIEHNAEYADECLSFSQYPLSAACAIGRLVNACENHWGIL
jgi:rRNA small subunit pseudouridine methyltransferase Nep1